MKPQRSLVGVIGLWIALGAVAAPALADEAPSVPPEGKKPQVRTYTSVTVVDDPNKVPRLPGRPPAPAPVKEAQPSRPAEPPRRDDGQPTRAESLHEVRSELRELRRSLRAEDAEARRGQPAGPTPTEGTAPKAAAGKRADGKAVPDRDPAQRPLERALERAKARAERQDEAREELRGAKKALRESLPERLRERRD